MFPTIADKRRQLLESKYNQRSQLDFSVKKVCGPKAKYVTSSTAKASCEASKVELLDPNCEYHLLWNSPPENVLVIKKFKDVGVTKKFMEFTTWLVEQRGLTVIVEPSVLMEPTVKDADSYTKVREKLESWEDGVAGRPVVCLLTLTHSTPCRVYE